MAHAGGRPSLFREDMTETVLAYFATCKAKNVMPYLEDVAMELGIDIDTLETWEKQEVADIPDEFVGAIKKVRLLQRKNLMVGGLSETFNTGMSIFLLKANHGLIETSRQELTGKNGQPLLNDGGMIILFSKLLSKALPNGKQNRSLDKKQSLLIDEGVEQHQGTGK